MPIEAEDQPTKQDQELAALRQQVREWFESIPQFNLKDFLENEPPDVQVRLEGFKRSTTTQISSPDLNLFCDSVACSGMRIFRAQGDDPYISDQDRFFYLTYKCSNCSEQTKCFSLTWKNTSLYDGSSKRGILAQKLGEFPAFGPLLPSRLISLIGPDRETFLQGARAEARGLGIGAFAYYRRVVENQKNRIISEIAKVANLLNPSESSQDIFK
jgi:hypothetical protein